MSPWLAKLQQNQFHTLLYTVLPTSTNLNAFNNSATEGGIVQEN